MARRACVIAVARITTQLVYRFCVSPVQCVNFDNKARFFTLYVLMISALLKWFAPTRRGGHLTEFKISTAASSQRMKKCEPGDGSEPSGFDLPAFSPTF